MFDVAVAYSLFTLDENRAYPGSDVLHSKRHAYILPRQLSPTKMNNYLYGDVIAFVIPNFIDSELV